ncbi:MAG: hypothetical protein FJZ12_00865 [Candidatus Omnitrophica bacterium]|nr:hypothetical protein [Candidatus Omnitrophota bacterium]
MPEEIKVLIEKIQKEGFQKAQEEKRKILDEAQAVSGKIIEQARQEAEAIIQKAKEEAETFRLSTEASLRQAGRDFIIALRQKVNALLGKIISQKVSEALTPQEMAGMINNLVKDYARKEKLEKIEITLNNNDLVKIKSGLLEELSTAISKGVTLYGSEAISAGFTISFDSGKSYFDFSDQALAEYLGSYFNKELSTILDSK